MRPASSRSLVDGDADEQPARRRGRRRRSDEERRRASGTAAWAELGEVLPSGLASTHSVNFSSLQDAGGVLRKPTVSEPGHGEDDERHRDERRRLVGLDVLVVAVVRRCGAVGPRARRRGRRGRVVRQRGRRDVPSGSSSAITNVPPASSAIGSAPWASATAGTRSGIGACRARRSPPR